MTVTTVSEAKNKLAPNKTKITKKSAVLAKLGKEIGQGKEKEPKNINLINGIITEYLAVKESIQGLMSELLTTSNEFNTSLELMGESAFIGEAAAKVVEGITLSNQKTSTTSIKLKLKH